MKVEGLIDESIFNRKLKYLDINDLKVNDYVVIQDKIFMNRIGKIKKIHKDSDLIYVDLCVHGNVDIFNQENIKMKYNGDFVFGQSVKDKESKSNEIGIVYGIHDGGKTIEVEWKQGNTVVKPNRLKQV